MNSLSPSGDTDSENDFPYILLKKKRSLSFLKMAIFSRYCPFSDGANHQGQYQKIARGEAIFSEIDEDEH